MPRLPPCESVNLEYFTQLRCDVQMLETKEALSNRLEPNVPDFDPSEISEKGRQTFARLQELWSEIENPEEILSKWASAYDMAKLPKHLTKPDIRRQGLPKMCPQYMKLGQPRIQVPGQEPGVAQDGIPKEPQDCYSREKFVQDWVESEATPDVFVPVGYVT